MKASYICAPCGAAFLVAVSTMASAAPGPNLINGGNFDTAADITSFWTAGAGSTLTFSANDAQGSPTSGSMQVTSATGAPSAFATQCIANVPAASYDFGSSVFGGTFSVGSMTCSAFAGVNDCSGTAASTAQTSQTTTGQDFTWVAVTSVLSVAAAGSVLCELDYLNVPPPPLQGKSAAQPGGQLPSALFDDVFFQNPVPVGLQSFDVQ